MDKINYKYYQNEKIYNKWIEKFSKTIIQPSSSSMDLPITDLFHPLEELADPSSEVLNILHPISPLDYNSLEAIPRSP